MHERLTNNLLLLGNSLMVQWSRLGAFTAEDLIPGWGTKIPQAVWWAKIKGNKNLSVCNHCPSQSLSGHGSHGAPRRFCCWPWKGCFCSSSHCPSHFCYAKLREAIWCTAEELKLGFETPESTQPTRETPVVTVKRIIPNQLVSSKSNNAPEEASALFFLAEWLLFF